MDVQLVREIVQFLSRLKAYDVESFQQSSADDPQTQASLRALWTRGWTLYKSLEPDISRYERDLASGFAVPHASLVGIVHILLLKTVLRTIRDASSVAEANSGLRFRGTLWSWFSDPANVTEMQKLRFVPETNRCLYLAFVLRLTRILRCPSLKTLAPLSRLTAGDIADDYSAADLLEELRLTLPSIVCSECVYEAYRRTFAQISTSHPEFLDFDDFTVAAVRYLDSMRVCALVDICGDEGWAVWSKFVLLDNFQGVTDELRVGFAIVEFFHQLAKMLFSRRKASIVDCFADDFGAKVPDTPLTPAKDASTSLVPEADRDGAANLDLVFPYYPHESLSWAKIFSVLELNLFGVCLRHLNLKCVKFMCDGERWETLSIARFHKSFSRFYRARPSDKNPSAPYDRQERYRLTRLSL